MSSWLESTAPRRFDQLAFPAAHIEVIKGAAVTANPPHLLISGPAGIGKTAAWRLVARQVLGPGWKSTTHVLQARDLARTAGAMQKFEEFFRPKGKGKTTTDSVAGTTSLDAFDSTFTVAAADDIAPAGAESEAFLNEQRSPVARLIIIEDADYLGPKRQPFLRRIMEESSASARFIFTARTPSRIIDALRSRTNHIRLSATPNDILLDRLEKIYATKNVEAPQTFIRDIAHVANGNLRKAIFLSELLTTRGLQHDRKNLLNLQSSTKTVEIQKMLEEALRGRIHDWRWDKVGAKSARVLKGAMGTLDVAMDQRNMSAEQVVEQMHSVLTDSRMFLEESLLAAILGDLAKLDVALRHSSTGRIHIEDFFQKLAHHGKAAGLH